MLKRDAKTHELNIKKQSSVRPVHVCVCHRVQLWGTIQHRTIPIIFTLMLHNHQSVVYRRGRDKKAEDTLTEHQPSQVHRGTMT